MELALGTPICAARLSDEAVVLLDQRALPADEIYLELTSADEVARAIEDMVVRGAPAIGVAAAMGLAIELGRHPDDALEQAMESASRRLARARPTAVNLQWALDRMRADLSPRLRKGESAAEVRQAARKLAQRIGDEDVERCHAIGEHGATLIAPGACVLTHCNAGALATGGYGTALGVVRSAASAGKLGHVIATETRPLLQGARLTAWELANEGIPFTLIADGAAGSLMARGEIDCVVVGADRIAANGDVANKIGTYSLAVLARAHSIPFYVAAPLSTVDLATASGADIPIEERAADEVLQVGDVRVAPKEATARNPAFDVTPADHVSAIVTERGIVQAPYETGLADLVDA